MKDADLRIEWMNSKFISVGADLSVDRVLLLVKKLNPKWIVVKNRRAYYLIAAVELERELKGPSSLEMDQPILLGLQDSERAQVVRAGQRIFKQTNYVKAPARAVALDESGRVSRIARMRALSRLKKGRAKGIRSATKSRKLRSRRFAAFRSAHTPAARRKTRRNSYTTVPVFYATDRSTTSAATEQPCFSGDRCTDEKLRYGTCNVSIPEGHKMGKIESPRFWKFEFSRNPKKHVAILSCKSLSQKAFFHRISERAGQAHLREAFVFVHGYNTSFEDAVLRTGQLAYDLQFAGAPILFSWPSRAHVRAYSADEATIDWSRHHFRDFLEKLATKSELDVIHVVAHSMGNRIAMRALETQRGKRQSRKKPALHEVILTAPDIDSGEFLQLAAEIQAFANRVTLYASSRDKALMASHTVHDAPRAGESGKNIIVAKGIDTVDATSADTSFMAHGYFSSRRSVLSDIYYVMRGAPPAGRHGLRQQSHPNGHYWEMRA
jgi:esterase/lipase superfamily enzyme